MDLRTAQNYSWSFDGSSLNTMNRDVFSRDLQRDLGDPYTRSRYHHLFINGVYWGLYQSQERSEAAYAESYFGGEKDNYDVVKAEAGPYTLNATDGNLEAWQQFWEGANAVAAATNETTRFALYQKLKGLNPDGTRNPNYAVQLDSRNLIDYMLTIIYGGNLDAPISNFLGNTAINNWYGIRDRTGDEGWRFLAHDNEHTLLNVNEDRTGPFPAGNQFQYSNPQWIFQQLWTSEDFRLEVADRVQETFFGDGELTPNANRDRFLERKSEIDLAIIAESARWGDSKQSTPFTKVDWQNTINSIVNSYIPSRTNVVLNQLKLDGLYPNVTPPVQVPDGGSVPNGHEVEFATIDGVVYYTIDGSDPRAPGGGLSPTAIPYNTITSYVSADTTNARWRVPNGTEGTWQLPGYNDASWAQGPMPLGFDTGQVTSSPGFTVRTVDTSAGDISSINVATSLLNGNTGGFTVASDTSSVFSYVNFGDSGNLSSPPDIAVPGTSDREQYAMRAVANIVIPAGTWTLAVGSDDGFRVTIPNVTFTSRFGNEGTQPSNGFAYSSPRAHSQSGGTFTVASQTTTTIQLDFYERGGGDSLELSLASGTQGGFNGNFQILQNGTQNWSVTTTGIPFDFDPLIETDIEASMANQRSGAYLRLPFNASDVADVQTLNLLMKYDDGFVAYLNGVEVARRNAPAGTPTHTTAASLARADQQAIVFETINISSFKQHLVDGANVLAIHGLNIAANDSDFFVEAKLDAYSVGQGELLDQSAIVNARALKNGEWSALSSAEFFLNTPADASNLAVTELNYNPYEPTAEEIAAGFTDENDFEFIELRNIGGERIDLAGAYFETAMTFNFSGSSVLSLDPNQFVLVVKNLAAFELRYGTGLPVAGVYDGALSNSGEAIMLRSRSGEVIDSFTYSDKGAWPGRADGNASSLEVISATGDYADPNNWRPSTEYGGSPGVAGLGPFADIVVNEVLTHTDLPQKDAVELFNTTGAPINIGGWYLSDSNDNYQKFRIPNGTIIPAGEYVVFDEDDFNPTPETPGPNDFSFSAAEGDDVWLLSANATGKLQRFADRAEFGAAANGVSFGRWPNGTGDLFPMTAVTLDGPNSGPLFGPVIISEVMYDASAAVGDDDLEFIELFNTTTSAIDLSNWRISGGADLVFPAGRTIGAQQTLVVVRFDPADTAKAGAFRTHYGIGAGVTLVGPYGPGVLDNGGEAIRLEQPDEPPVTQPELIPYLLVDQVKYDDDAPWPGTPDGQGDSLTRLATTAFGDFATSWDGANPTPGSTNFVSNYPPTITAIDDQTINEDGATGGLSFTIGDVETPLGSLTVTGTSSNTTLVPNANIVITGSGANRSVVVTPTANRFGTATISIKVGDGDAETVETFLLTVNSVNDLPTITAIDNIAIPEDGATGTIAFTVGDVETAVGSLTVTGSSSNTSLVPNENIVFGGSGANRTVQVTPAANQNGSATITITVSDGTGNVVETFVLAVDAVNDLPTITAIDDVTIDQDTSTAAIPFTVGDQESAAGSLTVTGASSNLALVKLSGIVFGGSGANRTVTITPEAGVTGTATITVTVSDGAANVQETFVLTVEAVPTLLGDTNGDGRVDLTDLNNVRNFFGAVGVGVVGDTNGDNAVDLTDLNNVRNNFGATSGGAPAPLTSQSLQVTVAPDGSSMRLGATPIFVAKRVAPLVPQANRDAADLLFGSLGEESLLNAARKSRAKVR